MSKYFTLEIYKNGICWRERNGRKLKNDYDLELYVEHMSKNNFVVTEAHTGSIVGQGDLQRVAIGNFKKLIEERGINVVREKIKQTIDAHGESPLFTSELKYPILPLKEVTD